MERFEEADFAAVRRHAVRMITDDERERLVLVSSHLWLELGFVTDQVFETW